ncbi:hypothetical protein A167_00406 [Alcanivorax sp. S71-1-4]|uniref:hypothetical protein n=1 Tax=Alcanivorax sp. S71-1-4 TaxID=1177159 RepID=UPI00135C1BF7|nr:hypothetical protein [Alcanivorax sp. S71-1-4]KAF0810919.1 hypothetical protein A167_00406 [Alcanivorax sp. S71-1-4]
MPPTLAGPAPPPNTAKRARYEPDFDPTLTAGQAKAGGFRPFAWQSGPHGGNGDDFRFASNRTEGKYRTGYHESAVTTDTLGFLRAAHPIGPGVCQLPSQAPKGSFFEDYTGMVVSEQVLRWLLRNADGFRTDTAQTILSAPKGLAAAHSGSGPQGAELDTTGQSAAHNLLRAEIMNVLSLNPNTTKGLTERALVVLMASMTVSSMAPGRIARKISGGTKSLKAGKWARRRWEANRNQAKRRVNEMFSQLTADEQHFVAHHGRHFLDSTQAGVLVDRRTIPSLRATSEDREETEEVAGEVAGGGYVKTPNATLATKALPASLSDYGMMATEPFRAPRRSIV